MNVDARLLATLLLDPVPPETIPSEDAAGHQNKLADMPVGTGLLLFLVSCGSPRKDTADRTKTRILLWKAVLTRNGL